MGLSIRYKNNRGNTHKNLAERSLQNSDDLQNLKLGYCMANVIMNNFQLKS